MEKRWISGLLVAISLALIGLMAIQVKWMKDTVSLREAQFHRSVDNALFAVADRLEQLEKMNDLRRHKAGRRLLQKVDAMRRASAMDQNTEVVDGGVDSGAMDPVLFPPEPMSSDTSAALRTDIPPALREGHEELVTEMVRGILATELARDIRDRIDPGLLDSLLAEEFAMNGVVNGFRYGVFTEDGEQVLLGQEAHADSSILATSPFRTKLFRHDLAGPFHYLHVDVLEKRGALWSGMLPMSLISGLFIGIIVLAFVYTIRTIFRQKRIGEIRTDLVNNLTHELKTPISTIGLACEALSDPSMPKTEVQVRSFVTMIRDENKRLGALVENVLQSAVLEGGHMVLKRVDLDLHNVIHEVVRSSRMQVSRRNGRMDLDLAAEIHHVHGDRIHLTNLLYNLIDNAVKYTEQEPRIRIATTSNDEGVIVRITDNGIGIAVGEQRKIFDRLYRVPTGNIHNTKGFGLGLSYVRTVVERHHGHIKVESTPGQGSTFHLFIPFEHVHTDQAPRGRR